ncbi:hypothetical protein ABE10_12375 [Bacillus toyonensis]|nr:hypothetical protein [Bacillus toyonensis]
MHLPTPIGQCREGREVFECVHAWREVVLFEVERRFPERTPGSVACGIAGQEVVADGFIEDADEGRDGVLDR